MSAPQSGPHARHAAITVSTSGDGPRPHLPRIGAGAVAFPGTTQAPLVGTDLYDWIALRRVNEGGVAKVGNTWVDRGLRIPSYVTDTLSELFGNGLVTLIEQDTRGMRRAALTDTGAVHYQQLNQQQQAPRRQLPRPEFTLTPAWLADHPQAHKLARSVWDTLTQLEQSGHHPGVIAALRQVLTHHRPTPAGRCRTCRRWRGRRRRFPCIIWHEIHSALR